MITVYSAPNCQYCTKAKDLLRAKGYAFEEVDIYESENDIDRFKAAAPGAKTVPQITVEQTLIGGFSDLSAVIDTPFFKELTEAANG